MSFGSLYPALKRLETTHLIRRIQPSHDTPRPGRAQVAYQLTDNGRLILEWHIDKLRQLAQLGHDRLRATT